MPMLSFQTLISKRLRKMTRPFPRSRASPEASKWPGSKEPGHTGRKVSGHDLPIWFRSIRFESLVSASATLPGGAVTLGIGHRIVIVAILHVADVRTDPDALERAFAPIGFLDDAVPAAWRVAIGGQTRP